MISVYSYASALLRLPDGAPPQLRAAYRMLWPVAGALWTAAVPGIWEMSTRGLLVDLAGAAVATRFLFGCWRAGIDYDGDRQALTGALADALQRMPEDQRREMLVRSARS